MKNYAVTIGGYDFDSMTIAEDYPELLTGLENSKMIPEDGGMIYVFQEERKLEFTSTNPWIAIDLVFITQAGKIAGNYTMPAALPQTKEETQEQYYERLPFYKSIEPAIIAVEFQAGTIKKLGLENGMTFPCDIKSWQEYRYAENIKVEIGPCKSTLKSTWKVKTLAALKEITAIPDDLFELNKKYVGVRFDLNALTAAGWKKLDGVKTELQSDIWLERIFAQGTDKSVFRTIVSELGHWRNCRYFIKHADGTVNESENYVFPDDIRKIIYHELDIHAQDKATATVVEELNRVIYGNISPQGEDGQEIKEDLFVKFCRWKKVLLSHTLPNSQYAYRMLNGMLRHNRFCDYGEIIGEIITFSANLGYKRASAMLCQLALTRDHESKNSYFWNSVGYALDRLKMYEGAFFCFAKAWDCNRQEVYAKNLWLMGGHVIPDYLRIGSWDDLLSAAELLSHAIVKDIEPEKQSDIFCLIGMYYEQKHDFEEAERYYRTALERIKVDKKAGG